MVVEKVDACERSEIAVHVERVWEVVDCGRARRRRERRLAGQIHGLRIGPEIMVERDVFLEDHDNMFDRRCGLDAMELVGIAAMAIVGDGTCTRDREGQSGYQT